MTLNEAITQLKDLKQNKQAYLEKKSAENNENQLEFLFETINKDIGAIDKALEALELYALHNKELKEMLNAAVNEMIKGRNCNPDKYLRRYGDEAKKLIKINLETI